ncbi:MAG: DUF2098 family protein [Candidatus Methanomethylicaceae archaeon]|nr:DUF2098 family protein [Candidatus Verstraetearchaeota archaeon]
MIKIKEGTVVIYKRTGTIGKIVELKNIDGKVWARLDTTNLLYDIDFLEEAKEYEQEIEKINQKEEKKIEKIIEVKEIKDEGTMDSSAGVCGAG